MEPNIAILVLDDEDTIRTNIVDFFEDEGFEVHSSSDGEEALELVANQRLDAVVVDMRLPGMDGNKFILRAHSLKPNLVFLIHTGSINYDLPKELRALGLTSKNIFLKPIESMDILANTVRTLVANKG